VLKGPNKADEPKGGTTLGWGNSCIRKKGDDLGVGQ